MFEVKVPIIFLGTVGFSLRREGRYSMHYHARNIINLLHIVKEVASRVAGT